MVAHVFISGFVQGVGFRHFIRKKAQELKLTGWVKNLPASPSLGWPDGRVEAVFQGSEEKIKEMIEVCKKGSFISEVENVEVEWTREDTKFNDFSIIS